MKNKNKKITSSIVAGSLLVANTPVATFANEIEEIIDNIESNETKDIIDNLEIDEKEDILPDNTTIDETEFPTNFDDISDIEENINLDSENNYELINKLIDKSELNSVENNTRTLSPLNYSSSFAGGDGTQHSPYQISTPAELTRLSYLVNNELMDTSGVYFELTSDIDLSNFDSDNNPANGNWTPIGYTTSAPDYKKISFKGIFNGNGYTISNVDIKVESDLADASSVGLFGCVKNAEISDLSVEKIALENWMNVGALIAYADGGVKLSNINISDFTVDRESTVNSSVQGGNLGALVGYSYTSNKEPIEITNCNVEYNININVANVGGLIGSCANPLKVIDCNINVDFLSDYQTGGARLGGVASTIHSNDSLMLKNINVKGNIGKSETNKTYKNSSAGLVGYSSLGKDILIEDCSFEGSIGENKDTYSGGLMGYISSSDSSPNAHIKNSTVKLTNSKGDRLGGLVASSSMSNLNIENANVSISGNNGEGYYFGGIVAELSGKANATISNSKIVGDYFTANYAGGIVGATWPSNLKLEGVEVNIKSLSNKEEFSYTIGGLIGGVFGGEATILNSKVNIDKCSNKNNNAGGLIGVFTGSDLGINKVSHMGDIIGKNAGKIVGLCENISNIAISRVYSIGELEGNEYSGGFIGKLSFENESSTFNLLNSYIVGEITGQNRSLLYNLNGVESTQKSVLDVYCESDAEGIDSTGIVLLEKNQMQGKETSKNMNLDFNNTWKINKEFYPTFEQINTAPDITPNQSVIDSTITVKQYDDFNLMDYIEVEDFEGDEVIVTLKEEVDTSKYGTFEITYIATDEHGLSSELTLNLKVNPVMVAINNAPILTVKEIILTQGQKYDLLDYVTANDKEDGDITKHIKVIEDNIKIDTPGEYKVVYEVTDKNGAKAVKEVEVVVKAKENTSVDNNNNNNNNKPSNKPTEKPTEKPEEKPQTGDLTFMSMISLIVSSMGLGVLNRKKK